MNDDLPNVIAASIRAAVTEALAPLVQVVTANAVPAEIIRRKDVERVCSLKLTALDDAIASGSFPRPIQIGERAVGFLANEVAAWQARKATERDNKIASTDTEPVPTEPEKPRVKKRRLRPRARSKA